ncbi:MAG TPA: EAL domain-containing protein [Acidimicrobiia bacterium]|nr:EAL domain-containing protein [Acidimicrobiia bacterium]
MIEPAVIDLVLRALPDPVALIESAVRRGRMQHRLQWATPAFASLATVPHPAADVADLGLGAAGEVICNLLDTGVAGTADSFAAYRDGASVPVRVSVHPLGHLNKNDHNGSRRTVVVVRERSEELRAEEHLRVSEEQFRVLAEQAPIGIFRSDVGLRLGYANARCIEILGVSSAGVHGSRWLDTLAPSDRARVVTALEGVLEGSEAEVDQVKVDRPDGSARWVSIRVAPVLSSHRSGGFVGSVEDVTERRLLEQALSHDATHDRLTGLPNRSLLWEALQEQLSRPEPAVAVLFVDLDDFKLVNDSFGHETGDELLLAVADRLTVAVRPRDLVTRFGGDEFVVVCADVHDAPQAERIARRLVDALAPPFTVAGREVNVSASMGLVLSTEVGLDPETVLRDADTALYQAKASGKRRWALFDERVRQGVTTRLAMANGLRRAIEHDQLTVHYQPIVDQVSGRAVGVEALSRWYDPEFGQVSPIVFITLAEEMGIIDKLGEWVLWTSCRQFARWHTDLGELAPAYLSVNLSARQLAAPGLVETVMHALETTGLAPRRLCLELTESVFMDEIEGAVGQLRDLCSLGVRLALDDFGTGYSSLSSLRRFPGEFLKIDRSFVAGLRTDPTAPAIVAAVVSLSEALGLTPVAEGVELVEDARLLQALGCRFAQGYLYARPMPESEATAWLRGSELGSDVEVRS